MSNQNHDEYFQRLLDSIIPPYTGGFRKWAEENIELPPAYAIPGRLDLGISPHLHKIAQAIDDPRIMQVNECMATQIGKSLLEEIFIPYSITEAPGPIMRIFHDQAVSDIFTQDRLVPMLKLCPPIKPLLQCDRFSTGKKGIRLPHVSVICGSANTALQHGLSIRYLLCEELHQWEPGQFRKFLARTTAFAGRRKIICASQPGRAGSEWEGIAYSGIVYDWQWLCPKCQTRQPFYWSKEKPGGFAGFNWDSVLSTDGENTNVAESSKTCWLECDKCDGRIHDTPKERRRLNDTGEYICIKADGDPAIVTFMAPCFVNPNLSFASRAAEYMIAKQTKRQTGIDELLEIFVTQSLGKFYKRELQVELSKILTEPYAVEGWDKEWIVTVGVDFQRAGALKYYVVRAWKKDGTESRRLDFGIARFWKDIEDFRVKHKCLEPCVKVDSGDGETTVEVYQECLLHGRAVRLSSGLQYISWVPTKGDGSKVSYKHPDDVMRFYSPTSPQDAQFPANHKLKGIPAPLVLFSNYSLKTILTNLRDNKVPGVKWMVDKPDSEYDKQMYSEGIVDVINKKTGLMEKRWMPLAQANEFFDCEVLCLLSALQANAVSAVKINESDIKGFIAAAAKTAENK